LEQSIFQRIINEALHKLRVEILPSAIEHGLLPTPKNGTEIDHQYFSILYGSVAKQYGFKYTAPSEREPLHNPFLKDPNIPPAKILAMRLAIAGMTLTIWESSAAQIFLTNNRELTEHTQETILRSMYAIKEAEGYIQGAGWTKKSSTVRATKARKTQGQERRAKILSHVPKYAHKSKRQAAIDISKETGIDHELIRRLLMAQFPGEQWELLKDSLSEVNKNQSPRRSAIDDQ
jgi:hypothetical protein